MVRAYDGAALMRAAPVLREHFRYYVNDDVTMLGGRTPYFHFIEGRQQAYPSQIRRAEWYWSEVQIIMNDFNVELDPTRCFPDEVFETLWEQEANRICGFCSQGILAKGQAVVDHEQAWTEGGKTSLSNARLAHRYCNWTAGQELARRRRRESEGAAARNMVIE
jgi:hypothetical protein